MIRLVVGLALAGLYAPIAARMAHVWWTDQYAGHGMFVPAFSALLLWFDRDGLWAARGPGRPTGALVVLLALGLLGIGTWKTSLMVQGLSAVVAVAGFALWSFGLAWLRRAAFPIGFLAAMVPLPRFFVDAATLNLQLFAARFAAGLLDLLGVPIYQEGVFLVLPRLTLEVAEVCNGLRFLAALVVLTVAFAEVSQRSLGHKLLLIAAAVPIAIVANATRVAAVGIGAHYWGSVAASGIIHHSIGKAVWTMTLVPLLLLGWFLRRSGAAVTLAPLPASTFRSTPGAVRPDAE